MNVPSLDISRLYGLPNIAVAMNSKGVAAELGWVVENGYSKVACTKHISSLIEAILGSTIENTRVGDTGRYGVNGDPELLVAMASVAMEDAINSGDVDANARILVEDNYDRFKATSRTGNGRSVRGKSKSGGSVTTGRKDLSRKSTSRRGFRDGNRQVPS